MQGKVRSGKLSIETHGDQSTAEICGSGEDIIFNWTALTDQICKALHISPAALAASMPRMIADYERRSLKQTQAVDISALCRQMGGDKT